LFSVDDIAVSIQFDPLFNNPSAPTLSTSRPSFSFHPLVLFHPIIRHTAHKFQRKIPTYIWASFFAAVATGGTLFVLFRRWKALKAMDGERGTVRFTQLATEDDDLVLEGTLVDYTGIDVAIGGNGNNKNSENVKDGAYGSI
jgi:hypothetical protein